MTITQTVEIPVNRRIFLDLPYELPVGKAKVELSITPESKPPVTSIQERVAAAERLVGIASKNPMSLEDIRNERLAQQ